MRLALLELGLVLFPRDVHDLVNDQAELSADGPDFRKERLIAKGDAAAPR